MQTEDPDLGPVTEWLRNAEIPTFEDHILWQLASCGFGPHGAPCE